MHTKLHLGAMIACFHWLCLLCADGVNFCPAAVLLPFYSLVNSFFAALIGVMRQILKCFLHSWWTGGVQQSAGCS